MSDFDMRAAIDRAIDDERRERGEPRYLMISESAWPAFKAAVPRNEYRKRTGTRFINAYRGIPISLHDEWAYGWSLMPAARADA